ncbi:MAG: MCE family protein [Nocardiopsaceae bacterium]|nr:MCE family protein [Nocardiopsaceae bacterium]
MKRSFGEMNPVKIGIIGLVGLLVIAGLALNSGNIIQALTTTTYHADFADAGGLQAKDNVTVGGLTMGTVESVVLQGNHVAVTFALRHGGTLGRDTGASISTSTLLGNKELEIEPAGPGTLPPGGTIPESRTQSPYDLDQILSTLTNKASAINSSQVAKAFDTIASTLQNSPPELRSALSGVRRLSQTIASRDGELTHLLSSASDVTGLLATRSQQIGILINDGDELLNTLYERRAEIRELLVNVTAVTDQLKGLALDNQQKIGPALKQLQGVVTLLNDNANNLTKTIDGLERYSLSLGETAGSGPWYYSYLQNIVPTNLAPSVSGLLGGGK